MITVDAACGCFIGDNRSRNEDNFVFNRKHLPVQNKGLKHILKYQGTAEEPKLMAVFDGMGGASKGEEAAFLASKIFRDEVKKLNDVVMSGKEFFLRTCESANTVINEFGKEKRLTTIGTTVAAVLFIQDEVVSCNVGDSKIFLIRDQKMIQISEDHTDEKIMSAIGVQKKPVLLQFLGVPETEMVLEPFISKGAVEDGDIYVVCSDGVTDTLTNTDIYEIVSQRDAYHAAEQLIAQVNIRNGMDNATAIVIKIKT